MKIFLIMLTEHSEERRANPSLFFCEKIDQRFRPDNRTHSAYVATPIIPVWGGDMINFFSFELTRSYNALKCQIYHRQNIIKYKLTKKNKIYIFIETQYSFYYYILSPGSSQDYHLPSPKGDVCSLTRAVRRSTCGLYFVEISSLNRSGSFDQFRARMVLISGFRRQMCALGLLLVVYFMSLTGKANIF